MIEVLGVKLNTDKINLREFKDFSLSAELFLLDEQGVKIKEID